MSTASRVAGLPDASPGRPRRGPPGPGDGTSEADKGPCGSVAAMGGMMATARGSKRASIVAAAAELIRTRGVHATSIAEIIAASDSSAGTIYHHFANKNEIVLAVAVDTVSEPLQAIVRQPWGDSMSPGALLRAIAEAVFTGEVESAPIVQLWAGSANDPQLKSLLSEQLTGVREEIKRRLARWLEAQGEPDASARAETLALVTMGQVMGMLAARTMLPHLDRDAYLDEAAALLDGAGRG